MYYDLFDIKQSTYIITWDCQINAESLYQLLLSLKWKERGSGHKIENSYQGQNLLWWLNKWSIVLTELEELITFLMSRKVEKGETVSHTHAHEIRLYTVISCCHAPSSSYVSFSMWCMIHQIDFGLTGVDWWWAQSSEMLQDKSSITPGLSLISFILVRQSH